MASITSVAEAFFAACETGKGWGGCHRLQVAGDHSVVAHFVVSPLLGERDVDRFFVDIHPHEHVTFRHGPPPLCVALRGTVIGVS